MKVWLISVLVMIGVLAGCSLGKVAMVDVSPKCGVPTVKGDAACWLEVENHQDCYVWDESPGTQETYTWSGKCKAGKVNGYGQGTWKYDEEQQEVGTYADGKMHGEWEIRLADGFVGKGPFVNGEMHGKWETRSPDGFVLKGPFVNGEKHGEWEGLRLDGSSRVIITFRNDVLVDVLVE